MFDHKEEFNLNIEKLIINECCDEADEVLLILTTLFNNAYKIQIMGLSIVVNNQVLGQLGLKKKKDDSSVSGAFANTTAVSDNPTALTFEVDTTDPANSIVKGVAVAEGIGNLTAESDTTYMNSLGVTVTEHKAYIIDFAVTATPVADEVVLFVRFGDPTPL